MILPNSIALDSNCYTYLIESIDLQKPDNSDKIGKEKIALVKLFFYRPNNIVFYLGSVVKKEYERIKDRKKLDNHRSWNLTLFDDMYPEINEDEVNCRAEELYKLTCSNSDKTRKNIINDCKIVAESELWGIETLISCNVQDMDRLKKESLVKIMTPLEYCKTVVWPVTPKNSPHTSSQLYGNEWWKS